jgi:DNA-binding NarL/FixJ family response regulator
VLLLETRPIRLFVVDPQPLIAAALSQLFSTCEGLHMVGTSQRVKSLTLRTVCPDVIVLAHEHGATDMCEMIAVCKETVPNAKICVVSCHAHPELLQRVLDAGADGYSIKDVEPNEMMNAIKTIATGTMYVDPRVGGFLLRHRGSATRNRPGQRDNLSSRESEIVKLIADGMTNREISCALDLSEKTVKNHVSRIFGKLQITSRTQAVVHAIRTGIA